MTNEFPAFKSLPLDPSHPPYSGWGIWGEDDELGCLNHLTPERILAATKEIKSGVSVGLSWSLDQMKVPMPFRAPLRHEIFRVTDDISDEVVEFNTQSSTQWDGFRHWCFPDGRYYNGVTREEVLKQGSLRLGIHTWTDKGIVGRGVLIDFETYAREKNIPYNVWSDYKIPLSVVQEIAKEKNIEFRPGDILLLRTGFIKAYESKSIEELTEHMTKADFLYPGLEGSPESLEWLWDQQFAAVAADSPGFEAWGSGLGDPKGHFRMHEYLLSGFGLPIGELFDLDNLAAQCQKANRWAFFFTSQPLKLPGGVGSPPNAIAIL